MIGAALLGAAFTLTAWGQSPAVATGSDLEGTSWELVKIEGTDAKIHVPAERGHYLLAFTAHGELSARIDCNRAAAPEFTGAAGWCWESLPAPAPSAPRTHCMTRSLRTDRGALARPSRVTISTGGGGVYEYALRSPRHRRRHPAPTRLADITASKTVFSTCQHGRRSIRMPPYAWPWLYRLQPDAAIRGSPEIRPAPARLHRRRFDRIAAVI